MPHQHLLEHTARIIPAARGRFWGHSDVGICHVGICHVSIAAALLWRHRRCVRRRLQRNPKQRAAAQPNEHLQQRNRRCKVSFAGLQRHVSTRHSSNCGANCCSRSMSAARWDQLGNQKLLLLKRLKPPDRRWIICDVLASDGAPGADAASSSTLSGMPPCGLPASLPPSSASSPSAAASSSRRRRRWPLETSKFEKTCYKLQYDKACLAYRFSGQVENVNTRFILADANLLPLSTESSINNRLQLVTLTQKAAAAAPAPDPAGQMCSGMAEWQRQQQGAAAAARLPAHACQRQPAVRQKTLDTHKRNSIITICSGSSSTTSTSGSRVPKKAKQAASNTCKSNAAALI